MAETKTCAKCGLDLPLTDFYRNRDSSDDHRSSCKNCEGGSGNKQSIAELSALAEENMCPAMYEYLAEELGVTAKSLGRLHVGYLPISCFADFEETGPERLKGIHSWAAKADPFRNHDKNQTGKEPYTQYCWTFPEYDANGVVVTIAKRYPPGGKYKTSMLKPPGKSLGRGLTYDPAFIGSATTIRTSYNFKPVTKDEPCSLCGKERWCMISHDSTGEVNALLCHKVEEGSTRPAKDGGFIHEVKPRTECNVAPLLGSEFPIFVVEGASDVAALCDLGLIGVGKPNSDGKLDTLATLLVGYDVVIIGENDSAGRAGMKATAQRLLDKCSSVKTVLPIKGINDLRQWYRRGLTRDVLLSYVAEKAEKLDRDANVLKSKDNIVVAGAFSATQTINGVSILLKDEQQWKLYQEERNRYVDLSKERLTQQIQLFMKDKMVRNQKGEVVPYTSLRTGELNDVMLALNRDHLIPERAPCWLNGTEGYDHAKLITTENCVVNTANCTGGEYELLEATPAYYSLNVVPHKLDLGVVSQPWLDYLDEVFNGDEESIALLQEWAGYLLVSDVSYKKFMMFIGKSRSSKSTMLAILDAVLGEDNVDSTGLNDLSSDFGFQSLVGKLAAFMGEAKSSQRGELSTSLVNILLISGGDKTSVRRKFMTKLRTQLHCRITLAMNNVPRFPDNAGALTTRALILHFPNTFAGREDAGLEARLIAEAPNILPWCLAGLMRLNANKMFTVPKASLKAMSTLRKITNNATGFVEGWCELGAGLSTPEDDLYDAWNAWSRRQGLQRKSIVELIADLENLYTIIEHDGAMVKGIKLVDDVQDKMMRMS